MWYRQEDRLILGSRYWIISIDGMYAARSYCPRGSRFDVPSMPTPFSHTVLGRQTWLAEEDVRVSLHLTIGPYHAVRPNVGCAE